jgi:hypothetical protein
MAHPCQSDPTPAESQAYFDSANRAGILQKEWVPNQTNHDLFYYYSRSRWNETFFGPNTEIVEQVWNSTYYFRDGPHIVMDKHQAVRADGFVDYIRKLYPNLGTPEFWETHELDLFSQYNILRHRAECSNNEIKDYLISKLQDKYLSLFDGTPWDVLELYSYITIQYLARPPNVPPVQFEQAVPIPHGPTHIYSDIVSYASENIIQFDNLDSVLLTRGIIDRLYEYLIDTLMDFPE